MFIIVVNEPLYVPSSLLGSFLDLTRKTVPYDPLPSSFTISKSFEQLPITESCLSICLSPYCNNCCVITLVSLSLELIIVFLDEVIVVKKGIKCR